MSTRLAGEGLGTALLLYVIVSSGIAAETLSTDSGLRLFAHAIAVGLGLAALIATFQTVSGSHFNPSVTLAFWRIRSITGRDAGGYVIVQVVGALVGVMAANASFAEPAFSIATTVRDGLGLIIAESIGTFVLVLAILVLVRTDRSGAVPAVVGAWVAAIVFATSSTGFANPAVTLARIFTDTYTGIAPSSVVGFLAGQLIAGLLAAWSAAALYPVLHDETMDASR